MIKVNKSSNIPNTLLVKGPIQRLADMLDYFGNHQMFVNTEKDKPKKEFFSTIYGAKDVKKQLKADQYNKCCYCESKFTANSPGDVEHFRPKGGFKEEGITGLLKPGYYWLAYDWNNLFFSCEVCNRSFKKNYFPLVDPDQRAIPHTSNIIEQALLISPLEDPSIHLEFYKDIIKAKDERGAASIKYYGLKRTGLLEKRLSSYKIIKNMGPFKGDVDKIDNVFVDRVNEVFVENYSIDELKDIFNENNKYIEEAISDKGEFSLMCRTSFG